MLSTQVVFIVVAAVGNQQLLHNFGFYFSFVQLLVHEGADLRLTQLLRVDLCVDLFLQLDESVVDETLFEQVIFEAATAQEKPLQQQVEALATRQVPKTSFDAPVERVADHPHVLERPLQKELGERRLVEELVAERQNQLRHEKRYLAISEQREFLDGKNAYFDVAELAVEEGKRFLWLHVRSDFALLERLVADFYFVVVRKVDELD